MKNEMIIPADTTLIGELRTNSKITLEGRVEGSGIINNTLLISAGAVWVGNIIAETIIIDGSVKGNIVAKQKLLLLSNAKVFGSLYSQQINVENGAAVTGKMQMNAPAPLDLINDPTGYALKAAATLEKTSRVSKRRLPRPPKPRPTTESSKQLPSKQLSSELQSPKHSFPQVDVA